MKKISEDILAESMRFFQALEASTAYQDFVKGFFPYQGVRVLHLSCLKEPLLEIITLQFFDPSSNTRALVSLETLPKPWPCMKNLNALFQRMLVSFEGRIHAGAGYAWSTDDVASLVCTPTGPYPRFRFYDIDHDDPFTKIAKILDPWPFETMSWMLKPLASAHEGMHYAQLHPELPSLLQSLEPLMFRGYRFHQSPIGILLTAQNQGGQETLLDVF